MNVTPVFFCSHRSSSALFSCTFLSFLTLLRLSGDFSHPDHRSPIICLLHHSRACPSSVIIPVPASQPIYSSHLLLFFFIHILIFVCVSFSLSLGFFLSQVAKQMSGWIEHPIAARLQIQSQRALTSTAGRPVKMTSKSGKAQNKQPLCQFRSVQFHKVHACDWCTLTSLWSKCYKNMAFSCKSHS